MGRRKSIGREPLVRIDGVRLKTALRVAQLTHRAACVELAKRRKPITPANLGRMVGGQQGECREEVRDALAKVLLPRIAGASHWLGAEAGEISIELPVAYTGHSFAYHPNVRGVHLRLTVRPQRAGMEGNIEPDDILRAHFVARAIPTVASYDNLVALLGAFWEATNISSARELAARAAGHVRGLPDLDGPIGADVWDRMETERARDRSRAMWRYYLEPTTEEAVEYCEHALALLDSMLAPWLPKSGDSGRPPEPQSVPKAVLDAFCAAFPFSGFGELLEPGSSSPTMGGSSPKSPRKSRRK